MFEDYDDRCFERDDDYNVFEERQLDLDREAGEYDYEDSDESHNYDEWDSLDSYEREYGEVSHEDADYDESDDYVVDEDDDDF